MVPAVARKFLETFDAAVSVLLFARTELEITLEPEHVVKTEDFFNDYRRWKPRVPVNEATMIELLKLNGYDIHDGDEPFVIVGVRRNSTKVPAAAARRKVVNARRPLPDRELFHRASHRRTLGEAAKELGMSTKRLRRTCRAHSDIAKMFERLMGAED